MLPHILYRTISVTHLSAYLIHLKKVCHFDTNLISVGCVGFNRGSHLLQLVGWFSVVVDDQSRAIGDTTECDIALEHSLPSGGPAQKNSSQ